MSFGTAIDFSAAFPSPESVKSAGHRAVISYVSDPRPGAEWMKAKPLTREWADRYRQSGLAIVSNFQFGKGDTADWKGGFDAGVRYARRCQDLHLAVNGPPNAVLYASIDDNPTLTQYNQQIAPYLRGWESVIGHDRLGVYGNSLVHAWCQEDGIGSFWWLANWGGTRTPDEHTHIHQVRIDKDTVDGIGVDINEILRPDYGQWSTAPPPNGPVITVADQFPVDVTMLGEADSGLREATQCFVVHTSEPGPYRNGDPGTAENLARYCNNTANGASYNMIVGRTGHSVRINDDDYAPWAAGWTANKRCIHVCLHGWSAQSRTEWLTDCSAQLETLAQMAAFYCRKYGLPAVKVDGGQIRGGAKGLCGHADTSNAWGETDHTDPGQNFPWDVVVARVQAILDPHAQPPQEDDMAPYAEQLDRIESLLATGIGRDTSATPPTYDGVPWAGSPRQIATAALEQSQLAADRAADCSRKLDQILAVASASGAVVDVAPALKAALSTLTLKASN